MSVRHFRIELKAEGPVHIGNGKEYSKKAYFPNGLSISVLDVPKFASKLNAEQLANYCEFLETNSQKGLQEFFRDHPELRTVANECVAYTVGDPFAMGGNLARSRGGRPQFLPVAEFVKDAYGCPYVPGSSVKGMLRTAVLTSIVSDDTKVYESLYDSELARGRDRKRADKRIVKRALWKERPDKDDSTIMNDIMRHVSVSDSEPLSTDDLVFVKKYDKFSKADDGRHKKDMGRISDARYYEGNELNIYRECLKPGTRISLTLDIDDKIDEYLNGWKMDSEGICLVLKRSFELYEKCFLNQFDTGEGSGAEASVGQTGASDDICQYIVQAGSFAGKRCRNRAVAGTGYCNMHQSEAGSAATQSSKGTQGDRAAAGKECTCFIGGGVDFDSKTIVNALLEDKSARLNEISRILYAQFPTKIDRSRHARLWDEVRDASFEPKKMESDVRRGRLIKAKIDHRHWRDVEFGVSPHTVKLGILNRKKYPMGKCAFSIREA